MNNVPQGWIFLEFGAFAFLAKDKYVPNLDEHKQCIELEHIEKETGKLISVSDSSTHTSVKNKFAINDVLFGKLRPYLKKYYKPAFEGVCSTEIWVLRGKQAILQEYLFLLIQSDKFISACNVSTGSRMPRADWSFVSETPFLLPPINEQKKIAEVLGTWDLAIEELTGLIAEKKELKRGLMQRLLTGTQRLPGFTKPWKKIKLSDVLEECVETTTTNNQYEILTSSRRGIFRQEDYFDKQVASQDNIGYKIIRNGDFTYRAMTDDDKFCFNQLTDFEIGIVSPAYAVFRTKKIPGNILKFILNSERFGYELLKEAQGGTRKSLKYNSLIKLQIYVPDDEEEMARLSECLRIADSEIDLLNQQLDVLREQKRGLMQKLLTGEIRVKVDTEAC